MEYDFLEEVARYVGFRDEHARILAELKPSLEPAFDGIVERFYAAIMASPDALAVFTGGLAQIERQKSLLAGWLHGVLSGRYDAEYVRMRARIGRTHVRIKLDQRYVLGGMSLVREGLHDALSAALAREPALAAQLAGTKLALARRAIDKICDIELAIMMQTYAEDYAARTRDIERLATLGQLAGFIGHELRNPLAVMETSLHLLRKRLPEGDEAVTRHTKKLGEQLAMCGSIISSLLELARDRPLERSPVHVRPLIEQALENLILPTGVVLSQEIDPQLPEEARVDAKQLRQLIVNLISNAIDALVATEGARRIVIGAAREGDALLITVDDSGGGIAEDFRARLFQPLATTRQKGLGLGLALCRRIVEKHGGDIRAQPGPLGGARFEARFPGAYAS